MRRLNKPEAVAHFLQIRNALDDGGARRGGVVEIASFFFSLWRSGLPVNEKRFANSDAFRFAQLSAQSLRFSNDSLLAH